MSDPTEVPTDDTGGLRLVGVGAAPGGNPVLRDVDLVVPAGSTTTVLGPSGTGKTTLLRVVAGLESASAGRVLVDGEDVTSLPPHQRRIGVVFQEPRLFPHRDVVDNVAFGLEVRGVDRATRRDRACALLARVGLSDLGDRTVEGLSGGEQQRVNLARALAVEPRLLLLDEPLSSVDPERRDELRRVVADVTTGVTAVHVTHDRAEAAELGDQIAVLLDGRVAQHAPPRVCFERPAGVGVASLLGARLLTGEVRGGVLPLGGGSLSVDGPDGPATVAVRPEHVTVDDDGPLVARVTAAAYRGPVVRVTLALDGTDELDADLPATTALAAGDEVRVTVQRCWRLPGGRSTATSPTT